MTALVTVSITVVLLAITGRAEAAPLHRCRSRRRSRRWSRDHGGDHGHGHGNDHGHGHGPPDPALAWQAATTTDCTVRAAQTVTYNYISCIYYFIWLYIIILLYIIIHGSRLAGDDDDGLHGAGGADGYV